MLSRFFRQASGWLDATSRERASHVRAESEATFDLSEEWNLTYELLDDTPAWRERVVHEILLRDSDHIDAAATYQVRVPLEVVHRYEPRAQVGDRVRLLLPFAVRPKRLLLNVDMAGAEGNSASLLLKRDAALVQAGYMTHVDGRPLKDQPLGGALWAGVSAYTTWAWREHYVGLEQRARMLRWLGLGGRWRPEALANYLNADLELGVDARQVTKWLGQTEDARRALVDALGEGDDPESSSECILLAIPFMPVRPDAIADIDILIEEYCAAVASMSPRAQRVLAELGRRWQVIIDTAVPVGRPCTVKLSEQRPWLNSPSPYLEQEFTFGDATSTHVEIRAADHGVMLGHLRVRDVSGERVDVRVGDDARTTADAIALYTDASSLPSVARVGLRAQPRRSYRRPILWLQLLIAMAAVTMLSLPRTFTHLVESLALLTFPLTLAGAVVLTREATSLAERLLRRRRAFLMVSIAALWALALSRLLLHADIGWAETAWARARDFASSIA